MSELQPPSIRVSPDHDVEQFMGQVNAMKPDLHAERALKVKDEEDED